MPKTDLDMIQFNEDPYSLRNCVVNSMSVKGVLFIAIEIRKDCLKVSVVDRSWVSSLSGQKIPQVGPIYQRFPEKQQKVRLIKIEVSYIIFCLVTRSAKLQTY